MPKLNKAAASAVEEASTSNYEPLDEGVYDMRLRGVEVREGMKAPYWTWELEVTEGDNAGRRLWLNTSLSEAALWKMKEVFDAFGVDSTTDTDELLGKHVRAVVVQRVIQAGPRSGEISNQIDKVMPANAAASAPAAKKNDSFPF